MRLRIIIERAPDNPTSELPLFKSLVERRPMTFRAFLGSIGAHLAVLALLSAGSHYLAEYHKDDLDWSTFHVEPLRLNLAETIYFPRSGADPAPAAAKPKRAGAPAPKAAGASSVPDALQLPSASTPLKNAPIVLQAEPVPKAVKPPTALPALAFWARQDLNRPKPRLRDVVMPGRAEAPGPTAQPDGTPVLAVPNRETAVSDVNVALPQTRPQTTPALPAPNTATVPLRVRNTAEPRTASFEAQSGQAVNVIALASERNNGRIVEVPRGFQNLPPSTTGREGGASPGDRGRTPADQTGASGQNSAPAQTPAAGQKPAPAQNPGAAQNTAAAQNPTSDPGTPSAQNAAAARGATPSQTTGGVTQSVPQNGNPFSAADATLVLRKQHPANGSFDVVVMQSGGREDALDLGGMLTGNPVYTVYLNVGDQKEWLMQYCVPGRADKQSSPYQINVDDAGSITPPYPISTVIPAGARGGPTLQRTVLRGSLTAAGNMQITAPRTQGNSPMSQLVALVGQWQFRPALRNNKAIDVEFVLVIPSQE